MLNKIFKSIKKRIRKAKWNAMDREYQRLLDTDLFGPSLSEERRFQFKKLEYWKWLDSHDYDGTPKDEIPTPAVYTK